MSEQVRIKGTIHQIRKMFISTTLEDLCKYELYKLNDYEDFDLPEGYDTNEEYLLDKYYNKYIVRKGCLYEINVENCDLIDEFFDGEFIDCNGSMKFHASYYNGGCSLHEAINECINNVK